MKRLFAVSIMVALAVAVSGVSLAQGNPPPPPPADKAMEGPGGPGGPGFGGPERRFDPAQMRQRMLARAKDALEISDEDWKTVAPLAENVLDAQMAVPRGGRMFRGGGPGGPPRSPGMRARMPEEEALQKVLDSKTSTKDQIQTALKNFREARAKKEKELQDARQALREVLTLRQEAMLVSAGFLD